MKVKVILVLVIIYLAGAFSWWTYSLLSLSKSDYEFANDNMILKARWIENEILHNTAMFYSNDGERIYFGKSLETLDTTLLNKYVKTSYHNEYEISYLPYLTGVKIQVEASRQLRNKTFREYQIRRRAYISESVFFMLLMIAGFIWIFASVDKIINLNKLQKNFMLAVTHELKTPVAALKLMMQTLVKHNLEESKRKEVINKSEQSTDRLANLIDELLLAIKVEHKELKTYFDWVELDKLIRELTQEFSSQPNFKGSITLNTDKELTIWGDYLSLKTCFKNIIENAVKYAGSPLELVISIDSYERTVSFADQGPGIPTRERRKIFRQFYRIGDENVRITKGTGLGLFLVKNLLKIHKANIKVLTNSPKGTIFRIKF